MADAKKLAPLLIAGGVGAGALYWWLTRAPPVGKHRLTVNALADSVGVGVSLTVDTNSLTTPGYLDLDPGTYTITVPESIEVAGEEYFYSTHEVV